MKYLLVLQFPFSALCDYDALVVLEDSLSNHLADCADVDGHDAGSGEMNIFIHTDDPVQTFGKIRSLLHGQGLLSPLSAAYRLLDDEDYTRLWPEGSFERFEVV